MELEFVGAVGVWTPDGSGAYPAPPAFLGGLGDAAGGTVYGMSPNGLLVGRASDGQRARTVIWYYLGGG